MCPMSLRAELDNGMKSLFRITFLLLLSLFGIWLAVSRPQLPPSQVVNTEEHASPKKLRRLVTSISEDYPKRHAANPLVLEQLSGYIEQELQVYASRINFQNFTTNGQSYRNVIASFGPKTPEVLVIGAHYDAHKDTPGADDNASGVAGLIELARLLHGVNLTQEVQLVAYTLEEPPYFATHHMGSHQHAQSLKEGNRDVTLMIALEMIGYFNETPNSQSYPIPMLNLMYPNAGNYIAVIDKFGGTHASVIKTAINRHTGLSAYSINAPSTLPGIDFSDHRNYWAMNYPAVMVTDTAFYRNHNYHEPSDTADTLDYEKMAAVVDGLYAYLLKTVGTEQSYPRRD